MLADRRIQASDSIPEWRLVGVAKRHNRVECRRVRLGVVARLISCFDDREALARLGDGQRESIMSLCAEGPAQVRER